MDLRGPQVANPHSKFGSTHSDLFTPTGALFETFSRRDGTPASVGLLTSQRLVLALAEIPSLSQISTITVAGAGTQTTPVNQFFSIYTYHATAPAKLALTADDGSTAWGTNALKTLYISRSVTDAVATSGSTTITSATAAFTAADVGVQVTFMGAGAAGVPLGTSASRVTIASVTNATTAVLSAAAGTSVASGGTLYVATPYTPTATGLCYLGILVNATVGNIFSKNFGTGNIAGIVPAIVLAADTSITTPATAPNPATNLANLSATPYMYVS